LNPFAQRSPTAKGKKLVAIAEAMEKQHSNLPLSSDEEEEPDHPSTPELNTSSPSPPEGEDETATDAQQRQQRLENGTLKAVRTKVRNFRIHALLLEK
jgi:hypothetical protein